MQNINKQQPIIVEMAELKMGKGRYVFCEMTLAGRMRENPAAYALIKKLVKLKP